MVLFMRKLLSILAALVVAVVMMVSPSGADDAPNQNPAVCEGTHIDPPGDPASVTVTAPDGQLISAYCVKSGSLNQGNGPVYVTVDPPAGTVTISHPTDKEISHYTVTYVDGPAPSTTTTVEVEETTTTTVVPEETTTTVAPAVSARSVAPAETLPVTGLSDDEVALASIGLGLVALGALLVRYNRLHR